MRTSKFLGFSEEDVIRAGLAYNDWMKQAHPEVRREDADWPVVFEGIRATIDTREHAFMVGFIAGVACAVHYPDQLPAGTHANA